MTFRAKPVVKRSRNQWEQQDRRNFLTNLAFGIVVLAALLILAAAVALSWYNDHLAPVGRVDGQTITKDELRDRVRIEDWRLLEQLRRLTTQVAAGRVSETQAASLEESITSQREQIEAIALERIIDNRIQARLATEEGVTVSSAEVDEKLVEEATIPAARHLWIIEVEPAVSDGELEPTAAQVTEARAKATAALDEIKAGKAWEDVAKSVSTDTTTREQGGDLGWVRDDDRALEEPLLDAMFELEANATTDVIEGEDGIFRIGRATEIAEETVDELFQTKLANEGIDLARYRVVVEGDVLRRKLEDAVVADLVKPGPQRRVAEIYLAPSEALTAADGVKARHILYSPNDEPDPASPLPSDDPAWTDAETEAKATYEQLKTDPTRFDRIARTQSDEQQARGTAGSGGKLGDFIGPDSGFIEEFTDAVLAPGLADGQVLEPFRTQFGWHVVQIMYRPPTLVQLQRIGTLAESGTDFAQLARDFSEAQTAGAGGDLGWVARGQLDEQLIDAIFATELGGTSEIVEIEDEGHYLFKVFEEETRELEDRQLEELRANAFGDWYQEKKGAAEIQRGPDGS